MIAAKQALARAATVASNGQLLSSRVANAGRNLTGHVDDIAAQVSKQITETEPDAQAITSLVSGLSGVTSIFGLAPPPPAEPQAATQGAAPQGFRPATPSATLTNQLLAKTRDLTLATDLVNERVTAVDKLVEEAGLLKACVPANAVPSLMIRPRVDLLPVKPGQSYVFSAEGGAGPVTATFNGQMIGEVVQEGANFTLTVADGASGSSALEFSDGQTTRTVTLVVDRGIEHLRPPPQANTTELTPEDCAPHTIVVDRTTLLTKEESEAGVTRAQIEAIQKGVGLSGDQVDGKAGTTTRGAICRFERANPPLEVTGTISQPLLVRFPVQARGPGDGTSPGTGADASGGSCAAFANSGTAEGARQTGIEREITPHRLCELQTKMGIQETGIFDQQTRQEIRNIRESRLQEVPSQDLTELTRAVIDILFPPQ